RRCGVQAAASCWGQDRQPLLATIHVLADLVKQGWQVRVTGTLLSIARPEVGNDGDAGPRRRVRSQLHAERDEQLQQPAVRQFVQAMESRSLYLDQFVSIFSLMRDGRDLAARLADLRSLPSDAERLAAVPSVISPYLQFITEEERCCWTGLRLMDIWRY